MNLLTSCSAVSDILRPCGQNHLRAILSAGWSKRINLHLGPKCIHSNPLAGTNHFSPRSAHKNVECLSVWLPSSACQTPRLGYQIELGEALLLNAPNFRMSRFLDRPSNKPTWLIWEYLMIRSKKPTLNLKYEAAVRDWSLWTKTWNWGNAERVAKQQN